MWEYLNNIGLLHPFSGWYDILTFAFATCILIILSSFCTNDIWKREKFKILTHAGLWKSLFINYPIWGLVQHFLMFNVLYILRSIYGDSYSINIIAALIFGALHFPNWFLLFPTSFIFLSFVNHMDIHHNLFALAFSHGIIATVYEKSAPKVISTNMKTWFGYIKEQRKVNKSYKNNFYKCTETTFTEKTIEKVRKYFFKPLDKSE